MPFVYIYTNATCIKRIFTEKCRIHNFASSKKSSNAMDIEKPGVSPLLKRPPVGWHYIIRISNWHFQNIPLDLVLWQVRCYMIPSRFVFFPLKGLKSVIVVIYNADMLLITNWTLFHTFNSGMEKLWRTLNDRWTTKMFWSCT